MLSCTRAGDATTAGRIVCEVAQGSLPRVLEGINGTTLAEALAAMRECNSLLLETHSLVLAGALGVLRDTIGAQRIVFGSGAAAQSLGATLGYVNGGELTDEEKALILGGNAVRVLKL